MIDDDAKVYNWFMARHTPHSLLMKQTAIFNHGVVITPFKAAGTRMAGHFIGFHKSLRLKEPLQAVVASAPYLAEEYGAEDEVSIIVKSEMKWKKKFVVLRAVWPLVMLLRTADSNTPSDLLCHRGTIFMRFVNLLSRLTVKRIQSTVRAASGPVLSRA